MYKTLTLATLAALASLGQTPARADHSINPGLALQQSQLPTWMRGTNDEAGGPANELNSESGVCLPANTYSSDMGGIAPDESVASFAEIEMTHPLFGTRYPVPGSTSRPNIQR